MVYDLKTEAKFVKVQNGIQSELDHSLAWIVFSLAEQILDGYNPSYEEDNVIAPIKTVADNAYKAYREEGIEIFWNEYIETYEACKNAIAGILWCYAHNRGRLEYDNYEVVLVKED